MIDIYGLGRTWWRIVTTRGPASFEAVLRRYEAMPARKALIAAWTIEGPNPQYHRACKAEVRRLMPLVARMIDRIVSEEVDRERRAREISPGQS